MRNKPALAWYFRIFDFVARERVSKNDLDTRVIHAHLTMVLSTGLLMWSYAVLGLKFFDNTDVPGRVGVIFSLIHLLSPLLFLVTANGAIVCSVALMCGLIHQLTFAYFTGGFESHIIGWLPILPLLAGFIMGRNCLVLWTAISTVAIAAFFFMQINGYDFPFLINHDGYNWALGLFLFGWLFLIFCTTWVHVSMKEFSEETLKAQGRKIDDLFRVLFHDLANSLGRINIGMSICEKEGHVPSRGVQIIRDAQQSMSDITQNVRRMYAVSKGKAEVDLSPCALNSSIEHLQRMFATEIEKKKIKLVYDFEKNRGLHLIVDPVSFNNQVLGNIFSNAIKFSPPGSAISISAWPVNHKLIAVEIKDFGIGMPEILMKSLFDMNKRTTRSGTEGESGTGFGMHIMKSFVEMYQGQVMVESVDREESLEYSGTSIKLILKGEWN
ncbi:MAG: HAMP domain-containing sensor histidine kinase [Bdellovibrionota bacterium]